jgi:hypothetical protein
MKRGSGGYGPPYRTKNPPVCLTLALARRFFLFTETTFHAETIEVVRTHLEGNRPLPRGNLCVTIITGRQLLQLQISEPILSDVIAIERFFVSAS